MKVFFILMFGLLLVTIVTSFSPRTITDNTETATYEPCERSLSIDFNTYQNSFEMTLKSDDGTVYPGVWQALRYSGDNRLTIMAQKDQIFTMSFILKNCNGPWKINSIGFKTTYSKQVQLEVETKVESTWTFKDYAEINKVSTVVGKSVVGDDFRLIFTAAGGILRIDDLFIELFCNCIHESSTLTIPTHTIPESSPLTIPTHSMPVPNNCPVGYTPIEYQYSGYGSKEFRTTINDILDGSDILEGSKKDVVVTINDFVAITRTNPSKTFMLMNLRMVAANVTQAVFTFTDANNISQSEGLYPSTSEVFYHMGVGRLTDLLRLSITFKTIMKEIQVGQLIMSACIVKESSTLTIPTHSMPDCLDLQTACALKPVSMQGLLGDMKVNCRLIDDFNIMICDGVCSNRRVATFDFDNRRTGSRVYECCDGDGEAKTVIVKCFDVGNKDLYLGEHSITYMEYNKCCCSKCGLQSMDGTGAGG